MNKDQIPLCAVLRTRSGERYLYVSRTNRLLRLKGPLAACPAQHVPQHVPPEVLPRGPFPSIAGRCGGCGACSAQFDGLRNNVIFEITQQCNLRCDYCVYSGNYANMRTHCAKTMSWDDLKTGLDRFAHDSRKRKSCEVSFYGGEALLAFDLVRKAVAYARGTFAGRTLKFNVSTNGLLLTADKIRWLAENPDISVMVTVNGPFHDQWRHRADGSGSLAEILRNLAWAKANAPEVWANQIDFICNISSLEQVRPLRDFYRKTIGKCPKIITSIERNRGNETVRKLLGEANDDALKDELFGEYLETGDDFLHVLFGIPLSEIHDRRQFSPEDPGSSRACVPFLHRMFVAADGRIDLCERVGSLAFGTVRGGIDTDAVVAAERKFAAFQNRKCRHCWAQRLCSLCYKDISDPARAGEATVPEGFCADVRRRALDNLRWYCEVAHGHPEIYSRINAISEQVKARSDLH